MRITIFGVGAMGCLFGAWLSPHAQVTLVGRWPEQLAALERAPLRLTTPQGAEQRVWLRVTADARSTAPAEIALILTKSPKTAEAARQAAEVLAADGLALTLQNGLGNLETLACHVGPERAAVGVTTQGATVAAPGWVIAAGGGPTYVAAQPAQRERLRRFADLCARAGIDLRLTDDVQGLLWSKLAVSAAINPLTALLRVPNGALPASEWARQIMGQAAREVEAVAAALGIRLLFDDVGAQAELVAQQTAANRSSMLQDVWRGAESEIEAICGAVIRQADAVGVDVPANRWLYALVKALDETRAARGDESDRECQCS